jgi:ElaA protein
LIRVASFGELGPSDLYAILHLRSDVFIVEQECAYDDIDGRDTEPGTRHFWIERDGAVCSALRVLTEPDGSYAIGRIVTAAAARGAGLAGSLIDAALASLPAGAAVHLKAQARLEPWYGRWGFARCGPDFVEDGILHVPMARPPQ